MPPADAAGGYIARPPTLSQCELAQLGADCTERINEYRSGKRIFTDGVKDPLVEQ
eukprot:gene20892-4767_t